MSFSDDVVERVWSKGKEIPGEDPADWRKDQCGATMKRSRYGDRSSTYGWEVDHINPDGGDELSNLQPLQWQNNAAKSDDQLNCVVTS